MLVVVEHRDFHALAQPALDEEAFRGLDVLEVDSAESGFQGRDDLDQLVGIALIHFDIEAIDSGEFLEEHRLAFHHRLGCERPDRPESEHRGSVGDHTDEVSARSQLARLRGVAHDLLAGRCHPGRVRKGEIALVQQTLGGSDRDLSRRLPEVILQSAPAQDFIHGKFAT